MASQASFFFSILTVLFYRFVTISFAVQEPFVVVVVVVVVKLLSVSFSLCNDVNVHCTCFAVYMHIHYNMHHDFPHNETSPYLHAALFVPTTPCT